MECTGMKQSPVYLNCTEIPYRAVSPASLEKDVQVCIAGIVLAFVCCRKKMEQMQNESISLTLRPKGAVKKLNSSQPRFLL